MASRALPRRTADRRQRTLITPEGLSLPVTVASRGARVTALVLDLAIIFGALLMLAIALAWIGMGVLELDRASASPAIELVLVLLILVVFFARFGYFLWFELGPRGATPGKRALGIRVAARGGGRLTAEAVIARNLMRDVEVFMPLVYIFSDGTSGGIAGVAAGIWLAIFVLLPWFNRDALRAGDLVGGTWVVESERRKLPPALSLTGEPRAYRFGEAELSVYGEHELQVLEGVLRQGNAAAQREVVEAICRKIGWQPGAGDEREFLDAFYQALRAHLERGMRFGRRKADKFA